MPHTSRHKKPPSHHHKTRKIEQEDGWTQVLHTSRRNEDHLAHTKQDIPPPDPGLSVEKLTAIFHEQTTKWKRTNCRRSVISTIERSSTTVLGNVEKAVCLALGSLSSEGLGRVDGMWQLVALMDIVSLCTSSVPSFGMILTNTSSSDSFERVKNKALCPGAQIQRSGQGLFEIPRLYSSRDGRSRGSCGRDDVSICATSRLGYGESVQNQSGQMSAVYHLFHGLGYTGSRIQINAI